MSPALLLLIPNLLSTGIATVEEVKGLISLFHPGLTDAELNAVLDVIIAGAKRHLAQAQADAAKT